MSQVRDSQPPVSGRLVVDAIRALVASFEHAQSDGSGVDLSALAQFAQSNDELKASPNGLYLALAIAASTIVWASHETGRNRYEILDSIAENFAEPS